MADHEAMVACGCRGNLDATASLQNAADQHACRKLVDASMNLLPRCSLMMEPFQADEVNTPFPAQQPLA